MDIADKYDEISEKGDGEKMEKYYWPTVKKVVTEIPIKEPTTVLDIGTGNGYAARYFASEGAKVIAIDISRGMLTVADQNTSDNKVTYINGDMNQLPIESEKIDIAFSMGVLPYASELSEPLSEICRVLSPGGRFYCCVNYYKEAVELQTPEGQRGPGMSLRSKGKYRDEFLSVGFRNLRQENIPNTSTSIPPEDEFPTKGWETREDMHRSLREFGTLLTIGTA